MNSSTVIAKNYPNNHKSGSTPFPYNAALLKDAHMAVLESCVPPTLSLDDEDALSVSIGSDFAGFPSGAQIADACSIQDAIDADVEASDCYKDIQSAEIEGTSFHRQQQATAQQRSSLNSLRGSAVNDADLIEVSQQVTPIKRRKRAIEDVTMDAMHNIPNLQTPPDQILEINSNSTSKSIKHKRLERNTKLELKRNFNNQQTIDKHSSESSSEFPVSSPSNPQGEVRKFPQRIALLKNTLPADAFERNLSLITSQRPQMTLEEKIEAWHCEAEMSEVEDVYNFDELFKQHEILKNTPTTSGSRAISEIMDNVEESIYDYDFNEFQSMMLREFGRDRGGARGGPVRAERPTTSVEAAHLATQRRLKAALENENKKRLQKERLKGKFSTTPPATSSSENEVTCHVGVSSKHKHQRGGLGQGLKNSAQNIVLYEKVLCPSSSEETSQDTRAGTKPPSFSNCPSALQLRSSNADEAIFRAQRPRHYDLGDNKNRCQPQGLIQMRLDFVTEKKDLYLQEKKNELFKTPTVPQKYLTAPLTVLTNHNNNLRDLHENNGKMCDDEEGTYRKDWTQANVLEDGTSPAGSRNERGIEMSPRDERMGAVATEFHQQHEFCNYLGLTGMSTANAVASAAAELAKCNPTRRSLRVQRLQQKEKTVKLPNAKQTKKKAGGRYGGSSLGTVTSTGGSSFNHSHSPGCQLQTDMPTGKFTLPTTQKEPEIKILYHISADINTNTNSYNGVPPPRSCDSAAPNKATMLQQNLKRSVASSFSTSTCPRSSLSENGDAEESRSSNPTPKLLQNLIESLIKQEALSPLSQSKNMKISSSEVESPELVQKLHEKFQEKLEASRKTKPSIFIVDSLSNAKSDHKNTSNEVPIIKETINQPLKPKPGELKAQKKATLRLLQKNAKKRFMLRGHKSQDRLHCRLLTRSAFNASQQRQLRSRKIVFVKTVTRPERKSPTKTINKSTQKNDLITDAIREPASTFKKPKNDAIECPFALAKAEEKPECDLNDGRKEVNQIYEPTSHSSNRKETASDEEEKLAQVVLKCATKRDDDQVKLESDTPSALNNDNDMVVVSSTTNNYEEAMVSGQMETTANSQIPPAKTRKDFSDNTSATVDLTKENVVFDNGIRFMSGPYRALPNPIKEENGPVHYIYYELDTLIVVQQCVISFWKYSKLITVIATPKYADRTQDQHHHQQQFHPMCASATESPTSTAAVVTQNNTKTDTNGWIHLGECRRLINDVEIQNAYKNRICVHNSIPIYVEMRCRELPRERRDCNLLSMYINVYYYNDDDMLAKAHSIQLDSVQSECANVIFTTITESRYFVMAWPHENVSGKLRTGLCKYSLTPQLDTLASIREFKPMRHEIRYIECTDDDKLLGFGDTQLTIWDHRSGDVLMNYDLDMPLGRNLSSIYYPGLEIGHASMIVLFQHIQEDVMNGGVPQPTLQIIACCVSHVTPSHRILQCHPLPALPFSSIKSAINTGEHLIITADNDEEIWVSSSDPNAIAHVPAQSQSQRFYARGRAHLIELTDKTLTVDSFANHILKLATKTFAQ